MGRDLDEYVPLLTPYAVHTHLKDQRGLSPQHEFLVPGEGDFDYPRYLRAMAGAGYDGFVTVEISKMVQNRPGYEPPDVARRSFQVLTEAARRAEVPLRAWWVRERVGGGDESRHLRGGQPAGAGGGAGPGGGGAPARPPGRRPPRPGRRARRPWPGRGPCCTWPPSGRPRRTPPPRRAQRVPGSSDAGHLRPAPRRRGRGGGAGGAGQRPGPPGALPRRLGRLRGLAPPPGPRRPRPAGPLPGRGERQADRPGGALTGGLPAPGAPGGRRGAAPGRRPTTPAGCTWRTPPRPSPWPSPCPSRARGAAPESPRQGWWLYHVPGGGAYTRFPLGAAGAPPAERGLGYAPRHAFPASPGAADPPPEPEGPSPGEDGARPGLGPAAPVGGRPIRSVVVFGAGGPLAAAAARALAPAYRLRLTDVRPLADLAREGRPQSPGAPLPAVLGPPHEAAVVDVADPAQVHAAVRRDGRGGQLHRGAPRPGAGLPGQHPGRDPRPAGRRRPRHPPRRAHRAAAGA